MGRTKLLLIDDELHILKAIERELAEFELDIVIETDSEKAMKILEDQNIDIMFTDQRMPRITGLELIIHANKVSPKTISILMTGYTDLSIIISAINEGRIFHYLPKPWEQDELIKVINRAIEHKKEQDEKAFILNKYLVDKQEWIDATTKLENITCLTEANLLASFAKIIEVKDYELYLHSLRVSELSIEVGKYLNLTTKQLHNVKYGGLLHDLGKIVIKDRILYKNDKLDNDEYHEMKKHASVGAEILKEIEHMYDIAVVIEQHHERDDGNGYPKGLAGEDITIEARIISIADAFDALTSDRIYRKKLSIEKSFEILKSDGAGKFDPYVLGKFEEYVNSKRV